jgi:beta-galactosidase/beta-glucuronidase
MPDFTGNIRYTASVTLDPSEHTILDLGSVGQTAEVTVNGKHVGTRIFAPYRFDLSGSVIKGENTIEITVANTCVHEQRDAFSRYMLIKPSGLLGPVRFYR